MNTVGKKSAKFVHFLKLFIAAVVFAITVAGLLFHFFYWQSPSQIVARMYKKMAASVSFKYKGSVVFKFARTTTNITDANLISSPSPISSYNLYFDGSLIKENAGYTTGFKSTFFVDDYSLARFEGVVSQNTLYLKADEISSPDKIGLDAYINKWLLFDGQYLADNFNLEGLKLNTNFATNLEQVLEKIAKSGVVKVSSRLPNDVISQTVTNHFKIELDRKALTDLVTSLTSANGSNQPASDQVNSSENFDNWDIKDIDVWIGAKDNYLYRLRVRMEVNDVGTNDNTLTVDYDASFNEFDSDINVPLPVDFIKINDLTTEIAN